MNGVMFIGALKNQPGKKCKKINDCLGFKFSAEIWFHPKGLR